MKFTESLKKNYQFKIVYNRGKSIANKYLVVYILKTGKESNHLGLSVSKKVGNSVIRSRVTRLIKESYRLNEQSVKLGFDIVVIARSAAKEGTFKEISKSLLHLLKKHNILTVNTSTITEPQKESVSKTIWTAENNDQTEHYDR